MNWLLLATKLPLVISGVISIVNKVRGADEGAKKAAVLAAIQDSVALSEAIAGKDLLNDATIQKLIAAYIDAEQVAARAKAALQDGVLAKAEQQ